MARRKSSSPRAGPSVDSAARHPLRVIVELLPSLSVMDGAVDLEAVDGDLVQALSDQLDALTGIVHNGIVALGHLLELAAAPCIEEGELSGETLAGLGRLLAELGDLATWATVMNAHCKYLNADFVSQGDA
jgi:hypothetical protein